MVTAGVRSNGLLALTAAAGEITKRGRPSAGGLAPTRQSQISGWPIIWPLAYFRSTLRPQGGSGPLSRANVSNWRFAASDVAAPQGPLSEKPTLEERAIGASQRGS